MGCPDGAALDLLPEQLVAFELALEADVFVIHPGFGGGHRGAEGFFGLGQREPAEQVIVAELPLQSQFEGVHGVPIVDDLDGRGIALLVHLLRPLQAMLGPGDVRAGQRDRPFHPLDGFLDGPLEVFPDRELGDLVIEPGLKMTGLGLLDDDHLLAEHLLVSRPIELCQQVAPPHGCPFGKHPEQRRGPAAGRAAAGDVLQLALDHRPPRTLHPAGGTLDRQQSRAADRRELVALSQRPAIGPGPGVKLVTGYEERR